jgi:hypothetical protein
MEQKEIQMKKFMFATGLALSLGVTARGANYYVDGAAAKGGDGSAKVPFATIQQAADVAQAGDTVFIKPGTYTETVKPKNSGKEGSPITFRNCPGEEKPTICAGDRVTGPWTLEGNGIYWAPCNWGMKVPGQNQVVVDGDLMIEARWPNIAGKEQLAPARRLFNEGGGQGLLAVMQFNKDDVVVSNSQKWAADFWKGGVVWGVGGWSARSALITGSQTSGDACRMTVGTNSNDKTDWWNNFAGGAAPGFLTGAKGALDCEKEFFPDEAAGRLYLMAPGGVDPSGLAVYAKKRVTVIDMSGLTNVVFTQVNTMMGGITLNNATRCALQNGRHLYSNHFYLMPSGRGDAVLGTTRDDPAGAAVYVSGESNRIEGCEIAYAATGLRLDGRNHVVRNCVITDNYIGSYFSGIFIGDFYPVGGECGGHLIERNTISRTGRGAVYWNEHKNAEPIKSTYTKCRVLYNHISDFMENTEDGGAVYAWCVWANGTEVAYNWIHGEHGGYHFNPALYADDVTADFRYHHNVIWDVKLGIGWNKPRGGHEAYNNTIWGRNRSVTLTVNADGCKVYNNLSNRYFKDTSNSEVKNNLTSGGFVGNPDKPTSGLDFRLASNSPAINAGVVIPGVTDGAIGAPDVGACEFGGPAWIPGAGTEPVAPAAPADFSTTAASSHLIQLGWTDLAQNETTYTVERSTDGKIWTALATLPADAFAYVDAGFHLKAGTAYQYRVAASNDYGASAWVSAKTATPVADKAPAITSPLAAKGWEGIAFSYAITASDGPAAVTATGLPKGLSLNPISGVISGYPEETGAVKIQLSATNAKGTDTKTLELTIAKPAPLQVTGGAISEYADAAGVRWTVFTFTNNGSFTVSGGPVEYLIAAGGGGGSIHNDGGGAGGAGGFLTGTVTLARGTYAVQVGVGGAGSTAAGEGFGARGADSYVTNTAGGLALLRAYGGGAGASWGNAGDGGSGGGGGVNSSGSAGRGWSGYFVGAQWVPRQGYEGGRDSGSGGGAGGPGADRINGGIQEGGPGRSSTLRNGTAVTYATGGKSRRTQGSGDDGPPNTGNGGGSGARINGSGYRGGNGGSGIVIVRFMRTGT